MLEQDALSLPGSFLDYPASSVANLRSPPIRPFDVRLEYSDDASPPLGGPPPSTPTMELATTPSAMGRDKATMKRLRVCYRCWSGGGHSLDRENSLPLQGQEVDTHFVKRPGKLIIQEAKLQNAQGLQMLRCGVVINDPAHERRGLIISAWVRRSRVSTSRSNSSGGTLKGPELCRCRLPSSWSTIRPGCALRPPSA